LANNLGNVAIFTTTMLDGKVGMRWSSEPSINACHKHSIPTDGKVGMHWSSEPKEREREDDLSSKMVIMASVDNHDETLCVRGDGWVYEEKRRQLLHKEVGWQRAAIHCFGRLLTIVVASQMQTRS
jgi:hypothetical protein